jgi:hypothetical protein
MNDKLLEPLKYYDGTAKALHEQNAVNYFDELLKKSCVNVDENRNTVKEYNKELDTLNNLDKRLSKLKTYRTLLIISAILPFSFSKVLYASGSMKSPPKSIYAYIPARSALVIPNISLDSNPSSVGTGPLKNTGLDTSLHILTLTNFSTSKSSVLKDCVASLSAVSSSKMVSV